jgi:hypothetical protein
MKQHIKDMLIMSIPLFGISRLIGKWVKKPTTFTFWNTYSKSELILASFTAYQIAIIWKLLSLLNTINLAPLLLVVMVILLILVIGRVITHMDI